MPTCRGEDLRYANLKGVQAHQVLTAGAKFDQSVRNAQTVIEPRDGLTPAHTPHQRKGWSR